MASVSTGPRIAAWLTLAGKEYVVLSVAELARIVGMDEELLDAVGYAAASLARDMRLARLEARLTQTQLARRIGRTQSLVSSVESGRTLASESYVKATLAACGLSSSWRPRAGRSSRRASAPRAARNSTTPR